MIKHIVFDFDGTIANTKQIIPEIINEVLQQHKRPCLTMEEIGQFMQMHTREAIKEYGIKWYQIPSFLLTAQRVMSGKMHEINVFENIEKVCKMISENYMTNIVSLNTIDNINTVLDNHNITCFEEIFSTKGAYNKHKVLKKYMKKFSLNPNEILYVGDELSDVLACRKCDIKIASVAWGYDSIDTLRNAGADYILHEPMELLDIV